MKRILAAFCVFALVLSGCSFEEAAAQAENKVESPVVPSLEMEESLPELPAQQLRYGRSFLSRDAAAVYDALCEAADAMDWDARVEVPPGVSAGELEQLLRGFIDDNPRHYWLEALLDGDEGGGERVLRLGSGVLSREEVAERDRALEAAADELLSQLPADAEPRAAVFALHDLLIDHTAYEGNGGRPDIDNAYGGLVRRQALCDGFARSYQYLLDRAGIDNIYITGSSHRGASHAWNAVRLDDGWCYVDVTWDSVASSPGMITHEYLCVTHEEMALQHFPDSAQYPALPEESHPGGSYYEALGYAVPSAEGALREGLAEAFARQLLDRAPQGGEQLVYLEVKLIAPAAEYEAARERFVYSLYELLGDMEAIIFREGWPVRLRTDGEILCSYNDAVQVLVLYPRAGAVT